MAHQSEISLIELEKKFSLLKSESEKEQLKLKNEIDTLKEDNQCLMKVLKRYDIRINELETELAKEYKKKMRKKII